LRTFSPGGKGAWRSAVSSPNWVLGFRPSLRQGGLGDRFDYERCFYTSRPFALCVSCFVNHTRTSARRVRTVFFARTVTSMRLPMTPHARTVFIIKDSSGRFLIRFPSRVDFLSTSGPFCFTRGQLAVSNGHLPAA